MSVENDATNTALTPTSSLDARRASLPQRPATPSHEATVMRLSKRQEQIIELVAEGYSGKEVARLLGMSPKTVESHLQRVFDRCGVRSRAGVVARWIQSKHLAAS